MLEIQHNFLLHFDNRIANKLINFMEQNKKRINDFDHASVLSYEGLDLVGIEWIGKVAYWVFNDPNDEADELIDNYINHKLVGDIVLFVGAQKNLKKRMLSRG